MMSHVMGLRDEGALKHAADLGIAMQLTNIARDITEDAAMGGIYLPLSWLQEAQIPPADVAAPEHREKLAMLSLRLLREADRYYRSGDAGLWHLSFRSACAVSAARQVYSEIGFLLLRKGARAWDQRTYVTGSLKVWVVLRGVLSLLRRCPGVCGGRGLLRPCGWCGSIQLFSELKKLELMEVRCNLFLGYF